MYLKLPKDVRKILNELNKNGYESYVVGGCVRDTLLGKIPKDWDICTNAEPKEVLRVFNNYRVIETGLQHGTVTVVVNGEGYEITTYRIDGDYSDGRHPNSVSFTRNLGDDLLRRDLTINALAYNEIEGIVDLYEGIEDLKKGNIKCVGNAKDRFTEDALRILRTLRFASVLGFKIDVETEKAVLEMYPTLDKISKERINVELCKILQGKGAVSILRKYKDVFFFIIPELRELYGFNQNNPYHIYDVWEHTLHVIENTDRGNLKLRLSALFHDIGKPLVYTEENGIGHFFKHSVESSKICEKILKDLRFSNDIIFDVCTVVENHDMTLTLSKKSLRKVLQKISKEQLELLIALKKADILGQNPQKKFERLFLINQFSKFLDEFDIESECITLKDLKINGADLIKMGIKPGPQMGQILNYCLTLVVNEELENNNEVLIEFVKNIWRV